MVRAGESLLKLTSDLKQYLILNDFPRNTFVFLSFFHCQVFFYFCYRSLLSFGIRSHFFLYFLSHFKPFFLTVLFFLVYSSWVSIFFSFTFWSPVSVLILWPFVFTLACFLLEPLFFFFFQWNVGCSLLRAEGFSCSFGVLHGGLGTSKLQFDQRNNKHFQL